MTQVHAEGHLTLDLSPEEHAFIHDNPVIRVSNETDWPPFDFTIGNQPFGMSIDVVNILTERLSLEVEYVNGFRWNELYEMFKNREIDVLQSVYHTESRVQHGFFTEAYYSDKTVFIVSDEAPDIKDIQELSGKILAVPKGWAYEQHIVQNYPEINLLTVRNMEQAFRAVQRKKADAAIELSAVARYMIEKKFMDGLKISGWFRQYDDNEQRSLHLLVRNDWPVLHGMFEKALRSITPGDIHVLKQKWLGVNDLAPAFKIVLTREEKMFLDAHPVMTVASEMDWPPFDFVKNGEPTGFAIDYLKILGSIIGVEFEFVNGYTWPELLEMGRKKQVDIFPGLWKSPEREAFLAFTQSYIDLIKVLAVRKDIENIDSLSDMQGHSIALPRGYVLTDLILEKYPQQEFVMVDNPTDGLKLVSIGKADGFIGSLGVINHIIKQHFIDNINVISEVQIDAPLPLYMAVREDWPVLAGILNKAMDTVTSEQFSDIARKWIGQVDAPVNLPGLTQSEKIFLENKERISLCVQARFIPFESMDVARSYKGIVADFYALLSEKIGCPIEAVMAGSAADGLACLTHGDCDMISIAGDQVRQSGQVLLTAPYFEYPLVIATDRRAIYIEAIDNLPEDASIGLSKEAHFFDAVTALYPSVTFVPVENTLEGLLAVQRGDLFGLVDTAPKIGYHIQNKEMVDLKISGELSYHVAFQAAVQKDNQILLQIMDKAVKAVTEEEKKQIFQTWMTLKYEQGFDYTSLWQILFFVGAAGVFFLYRHVSLTRYNVRLAGLNQELTEANKKLEIISYLDGLTGIANRRKFDSVMQNEWDRCRRTQSFLTLILLDIDYFKLYNDRYGHLEGDDCLKQVAGTISRIPSRPGDFVARYGGEEFAVILPETGVKGAEQIALKILSDIYQMKIPHKDSDVSDYLTVSLGVACVIPGREITINQFVDMADQLLYGAKSAGRNQYNLLTL